MAEQLKQNDNKIAYIVSSGNYHRKVYQNGSSYVLTTYTSTSQGTEYSVSASARRGVSVNAYKYSYGGSYSTISTCYSVTRYLTRTFYTGYVYTSVCSAPGVAVSVGRYSSRSTISYVTSITYTYPSRIEQYGTTIGSISERWNLFTKVTSTTGGSTYTSTTSVYGSAYSNKSGSLQTTYPYVTYIPEEYRTLTKSSQLAQTSKATTWEFAYTSFTGTLYSTYLSSSTTTITSPGSVFNGSSTTLYKTTNNSITNIYTKNATFGGTEMSVTGYSGYTSSKIYSSTYNDDGVVYDTSSTSESRTVTSSVINTDYRVSMFTEVYIHDGTLREYYSQTTEITTPVGNTATCTYYISVSSSSATGDIRYTY